MNKHRKFLERCRELALQAGRSGNTPVGAIIVLDGEIVGQGMEAILGRTTTLPGMPK